MAEQIFGVIAPHPPIIVEAVGGSRAEVTRASIDGLTQAAEALANYSPDLLVVMSPHAPAMADRFVIDDADRYEGSLASFGDSRVHTWSGDASFARELVKELSVRGIPALPRSAESRVHGGMLDHGVLVPLSFLDPEQRFHLVVLSLAYLPYPSHRALGVAVREVSARLGRRTAFLASGDLAHRLTEDAPAGYSPRAHELDEAIVGLVTQGNLKGLMDISPTLVELGGECGLRSFITLGGFAGDGPVPTRVLAYEGPWGVGYLTALVGAAALEACDTRSLTAERGRKGGTAGNDDSQIVRLARAAIESRILHDRLIADVSLSGPEYPARAGAFVSLHREGRLRGCIGTILPTHDTLAQEVAENAIQAATRDPRFPPVTADELADLDIKVDVLHPPETCSLEDLDPKRYGVVTTSGWRRGLLLPDLEGVEDVETQVSIAMQKAGIGPGEPCGYERFRVDRYT